MQIHDFFFPGFHELMYQLSSHISSVLICNSMCISRSPIKISIFIIWFERLFCLHIECFKICFRKMYLLMINGTHHRHDNITMHSPWPSVSFQWSTVYLTLSISLWVFCKYYNVLIKGRTYCKTTKTSQTL